MLPVAVAQSPSDVRYFRFCGSRQVAHNGANGPESKTTRMFCPVRQVAAPWTKSADCILFILVNTFVKLSSLGSTAALRGQHSSTSVDTGRSTSGNKRKKETRVKHKCRTLLLMLDERP